MGRRARAGLGRGQGWDPPFVPSVALAERFGSGGSLVCRLGGSQARRRRVRPPFRLVSGPATRLTLHGTLFLRESLVLIKRTLGGGEVRGAEGGAGGVDVREPGSWLLAGLFHSATLTRVSSAFSLDLV